MTEPVAPALELLFRAHVELGEVLEIGEVEPGRRQRTIPIAGGTFEGPGLRGTILPGGADWQVVLPDGTALIDTRYALRTHDGEPIDVRTQGFRAGPPEVLAALAAGDRVVAPSEYYFRVRVLLTSAAPGLRWLNNLLVVASAVRTAEAVVYDAYAVR